MHILDRLHKDGQVWVERGQVGLHLRDRVDDRTAHVVAVTSIVDVNVDGVGPWEREVLSHLNLSLDVKGSVLQNGNLEQPVRWEAVVVDLGSEAGIIDGDNEGLRVNASSRESFTGASFDA